MSVKLCREKLDNERPNLPIEKPKVVKSCVPPGTVVKSKGSKTLASKSITKVNKVLNKIYTLYIIDILVNLLVSYYNITVQIILYDIFY